MKVAFLSQSTYLIIQGSTFINSVQIVVALRVNQFLIQRTAKVCFIMQMFWSECLWELILVGYLR
jgi:hypothetical protein